MLKNTLCVLGIWSLCLCNSLTVAHTCTHTVICAILKDWIGRKKMNWYGRQRVRIHRASRATIFLSMISFFLLVTSAHLPVQRNNSGDDDNKKFFWFALGGPRMLPVKMVICMCIQRGPQRKITIIPELSHWKHYTIFMRLFFPHRHSLAVWASSRGVFFFIHFCTF